MKFKEITIDDKSILDKYLKYNKYGNSEYSFTNLFIWKHIYNVKYTIYEDTLFLASFREEKAPKFITPITFGSLKNAMDNIINYCKTNDYEFRMTSLSNEAIEELKGLMPNNFYVIENDLYDYLYLTEDLVNLSGKKYASKRNHIKKFNKNYEYEYVDIKSDNVDMCFEMLDKWCETSDCEEDSLKSEIMAVKSALDNIEALEILGGGLKVDGKLITFTLGQEVNKEVFNVCVEKALYEYQGAYTKINNEFAKRNLQRYKYINREEDLGLQGLRKAKQSYYPVKLLYKHDVILKK